MKWVLKNVIFSLVLIFTIKLEIKKILNPFESKHLVTQAALLDPRFNKLAFCNTSATKYKQAFEQLETNICSVSLPPSESRATTAIQTPSQGARISSMIWKTFDKQFDMQRGSQNSTSAGIIELHEYMNEPLIRRHEDPLKWGNGQKTTCPRLFDIVLKKLCILVTLVPCEFLFSKTGLIIKQSYSFNDFKRWTDHFLNNNGTLSCPRISLRLSCWKNVGSFTQIWYYWGCMYPPRQCYVKEYFLRWGARYQTNAIG